MRTIRLQRTIRPCCLTTNRTLHFPCRMSRNPQLRRELLGRTNRSPISWFLWRHLSGHVRLSLSTFVFLRLRRILCVTLTPKACPHSRCRKQYIHPQHTALRLRLPFRTRQRRQPAKAGTTQASQTTLTTTIRKITLPLPRHLAHRSPPSRSRFR